MLTRQSALRAALSDENPLVRRAAVEAVQYLGKNAAALIPQLQELIVHDPSRTVQLAAASALSKLQPNSATIRFRPGLKQAPDFRRNPKWSKPQDSEVPELIALLDAPEQQDKMQAIFKLGSLGPQGIVAVDRLEEFIWADDEELAQMAAICIGRIRPKNKELLRRLVNGFPNFPPPVRMSVADTIASFEHSGLTALRRFLRNKEPVVRLAALSGIGGLCAKARDATQDVINVLVNDEDEDVLEAAAYCLGFIGIEAAAAVPALAQTLFHEESDIRIAAASAISRIGIVAHEAVDALCRAAKDEESEVRWNVFHALYHLGRESLPALPVMIEALDDSDWNIQLAAMYAISSLGEDAAPAVPALVEMLIIGDQEVREETSRTLAYIGQPAKAALLQLLVDEDVGCIAAAANALSFLEGDMRDTISQLIKLLEHDHPMVRENCASALGKIGPPAVSAEQQLLSLLADPFAGVREVAARALSQIFREEE